MRLPGIIFILFLLVACGRVQNPRVTGATDSATDVQIEVSPLPETPTVGLPDDLVIGVMQNGVPVEGAEVQVEGNMTHAGMEPLFVQATEAASGEYHAALEWTMGGEWSVTVRAILPDGTVAEETLSGIEVSSR